MSYNIDNVATLKLDAWMYAKDVLRLVRGADFLPECSFLREMEDEAEDAARDTHIPLPNLWWAGEGSGWSFDFLLKTVAPLIFGHVEAVLTWEGGDSLSGLRIIDGKAEEMDVVQTLVPRKRGR